MKRLLIPLALLALAVSPALAQQGVLSVGNLTAAPGQVVNVDVNMDANLTGVAGAQFVLDFSQSTPPNAPPLTAVPADPTNPGNKEAAIIDSPLWPKQTFGLASAVNPGQVNVGIVGSKGFGGPGPLVTIPLQVPANVPSGTVYQLQLKDVILNNEQIQSITATIQNGTLTVTTPGPPENVLFIGTQVLRPGVPRPLTFGISNPKNVVGAEFVIEYDPNLITFVPNTAVAGNVYAPNTAVVDANPDFTGLTPSNPAHKLLKVAATGTQAITAAGSLVSVQAQLAANVAPWTVIPLTVVPNSLQFRDPTGAVVTGSASATAQVIAGTATAGWSVWTGAPISGSVSTTGNGIVAVNDAGNVVLLNAADGTPMSGFSAPAVTGTVTTRPMVANGSIYLATDKGVSILSLGTGALVASTALSAPAQIGIGSFPGVDGAALYVASGNNLQVLAESTQGGTTTLQPVASLDLGAANLGSITTTPAIAFDWVWTGTSNGNVLGILPGPGVLTPQVNLAPTGTPAPVVAPPFITPDGLVFVADQTGKVVEFQATGQPVANPFYNAGAAILAAPVALNGSFYAVDATGQLHIVSLANPTQATKVKVASATTPLQSPLVFGNRLYVGDVDGTFHAVDITNPAAGITTLALQDGATSSPAVAFGPSGTLSDAVVAVATADGSIVALPLL